MYTSGYLGMLIAGEALLGCLKLGAPAGGRIAAVEIESTGKAPCTA
jgi:hypothetical protein